MGDVYDILGELLQEGHGDKIKFICEWYAKYKWAGLPDDILRKILFKYGYIENE